MSRVRKTRAAVVLAPIDPPASIKLSFVCGASLSSRLIAWYGNGYGGFSHVDAILSTGELLGARDDVVGDEPAGVQIRPDKYEKWIRRTIVEIPCTSRQARAWEEWLVDQVGKDYDSGAIWGFITGARDHQKGHWICSACQTGALKHVDLLGEAPVPDSQVTPNSLLLSVTMGIRGRIIDPVEAKLAA